MLENSTGKYFAFVHGLHDEGFYVPFTKNFGILFSSNALKIHDKRRKSPNSPRTYHWWTHFIRRRLSRWPLLPCSLRRHEFIGTGIFPDSAWLKSGCTFRYMQTTFYNLIAYNETGKLSLALRHVIYKPAVQQRNG